MSTTDDRVVFNASFSEPIQWQAITFESGNLEHATALPQAPVSHASDSDDDASTGWTRLGGRKWYRDKKYQIAIQTSVFLNIVLLLLVIPLFVIRTNPSPAQDLQNTSERLTEQVLHLVEAMNASSVNMSDQQQQIYKHVSVMLTNRMHQIYKPAPNISSNQYQQMNVDVQMFVNMSNHMQQMYEQVLVAAASANTSNINAFDQMRQMLKQESAKISNDLRQMLQQKIASNTINQTSITEKVSANMETKLRQMLKEKLGGTNVSGGGFSIPDLPVFPNANGDWNSTKMRPSDVHRLISFILRMTGWDNTGNLFYKKFNRLVTYQEAGVLCKGIGARLAAKVFRIPKATRDMITKGYSSAGQTSVKLKTWIGFDDLEHESEWHWSDEGRTNWSIIQWAKGQPDNANEQDCAAIFQVNNQTVFLHDATCYMGFPYICEIEINLPQ